MPGIIKERRPGLEQNPLKATEVGDVCFVFARFFMRKWTKEPRWTTYHKMCRMLKEPTYDAEYEKIYFGLGASIYFQKADIQVAAEEALREFHRKVMVRYENGKYQANGEVFTELPSEVTK